MDQWLKAGRARPLVIAHGDESGQGLYPGNTLLYLQQMVELGVDALEMDLNFTADGHLVLIHDASLERTTDGRGEVAGKTLAELKKLNAAYYWTSDGAHFPYRDNPQPLVTIDEVFVAIPDTPMIIELKNNDPRAAQALARAIEEAGCAARVIVSSFHRGVIRTFRHLCPSVATGATMPEALLFYAAQLLFAEKWLFAEKLLKPAYQTMQLPMHYMGLRVYSPRFVRAARHCGLHLSVWTVDDIASMKNYIALGLDGIVTNRPDRLLSLLNSTTLDT